MRKFDIDQDGKVSAQDIEDADHMLEIELREEKADTQKMMAWVALVLMAVFTLALFSPILSDSRVHALADLLGLFYIAQAGVVGAYMGVSAWMSNNANRNSYNDYYGYSRRSRYSRYRAPDPEDNDEVPPIKGR